MTKKHFIAFADEIRSHNLHNETDPFTDSQIAVLASFCRSQNSRFDWDRWVDYIAGLCGPNGGKIKPGAE